MTEEHPAMATFHEVARKILGEHSDVIVGQWELDFLVRQASLRWSYQTQAQEKWLRQIARRAGIEW